MFARELAGEVRVARQRRVENALVFGVDVARNRALGNDQPAVPLRLLVEQRIKAMEPGGGTRGDQRTVEISIALLEFGRRPVQRQAVAST